MASIPPPSDTHSRSNRPNHHHHHEYQYKQSIYMGDCGMHPREVHAILGKLMFEWQGHDYRLLDHNCCVFSRVFVEKLGVGPVPMWLNRLGRTGATLSAAHTAVVEGWHSLTDQDHEEADATHELLAKHDRDSLQDALPVGSPPARFITRHPEEEAAYGHARV